MIKKSELNLIEKKRKIFVGVV